MTTFNHSNPARSADQGHPKAHLRASIEHAVATLDAALRVRGHSPLDDEQIACLSDPQRIDEAYELLDDLHFRSGVSIKYTVRVALAISLGL